MYFVSPFSLEILPIFLRFFSGFLPSVFFFWEFLSFKYWTFWSSPQIFFAFYFPTSSLLLFRKFLHLCLLNLLLSFSFVFWMFLSWRHGQVCVKHIYVHTYNWFLSWLKYAVFPLRMSRIILKVLSAWYLSPPLWFASSAFPSYFILETHNFCFSDQI